MNNSQKRVLIVSGGRLGSWVLDTIKPDDILIGADRGAWFLIQQGYRPDLSVGDFDSVTEQEKTIIQMNSSEFLSCDAILKDESDTELAFLHAMNMKPAEIVLFGALGTRFDHSLANVHLLRKAIALGIACCIVDEFNIIHATDRSLEVAAVEGFTHISLLPLTLEVSGVTLTGFQYPLHEATLIMGQSLAISNVLSATIGHVQVSTGLLLVIQSRDE
ncbi:MAG: thiamine diphosphokinase [Paenibacillaceae bacterium]